MQHLYEVVETSFKYPIKIWNHQFNRSKVMKPHWHDEIELIYCNQGSFELSVNGEKKFVNTKQLVLINSNSIHRLRFLEDQTKIITLLLSTELFDEFKLVQCEFDLSLIKDQE
ncbi:cupin domain-containing protein [Erysipelatoclostridium ramosum]|nr:cupin domain-containing protein [Thomasclavelia ramosa]MDB7082868.1 cupin domain-containing protein [Thomasclavelia ramosa]